MSDYNHTATELERGVAGAEMAAAHAGEEWKAEALAAFVEYAKTHAAFTTEDVRAACAWVSHPPDARAWGQVALAAVRQGVVVADGWARVKSSNGSAKRRWTSKVLVET